MPTLARDYLQDLIDIDDEYGPTRDYASSVLLRVGPNGSKELIDETFTLPRMKRFVALHRYLPHWICPAFGETTADFDKIRAPKHAECDRQIVFVLWELDDGRYGVLLPLVNGDTRAILIGGPDGLRVELNGKAPSDITGVLAAGLGKDPYGAVWAAVQAASGQFRTFRPREEKVVPDFVDYLGWCTWDAFYKEVDAEKVIQGLESFKAGGVVPKFVLLDDGWQDAEEHRLVSIRANPQKFPDGLRGLITRAKDDYGVEVFGVWHAFMGYWRGIHEEGEIAKQYRLEQSGVKGKHPWADEPLRHGFLVHRDEVYRFYQEFYAYLRAQGVDMTKVDNHNALRELSASDEVSVANMRAYQYAMQGAAHTHLRGNLLHCMCNNNDVAYHLSGSVAWRNSDDYFPKIPSSHGFHVHTNAMNALWTSTFALPDWDMFWSAHEAGGFHAAARAISGGPVYVSDKPEGHDFELLKKLVTSDGKLLRCDQPALPAKDCLFVDCAHTPHALKVVNRNGDAGVLGLFNCYWNEQQPTTVTAQASAEDLIGVAGDRFAVYAHNAATLRVVGRHEHVAFDLLPMGYELLTFAPVTDGVAALGLLDKLNGSAAIEEAGWVGDVYRVRLRDGGRFGLYCANRPRCITADGAEIPFRADADSGLVAADVRTGAAVTVDMAFDPASC